MLQAIIPDQVPTFPGRLFPVEHWYAVSVRSRFEKLVAQHLQQQSVNCFLPVYRSVRRWKDRRMVLEMALFPGYVFVNIDVRDRLGVLKAPGVLRFVTFQGQLTAITESDIRALESTMSAGLRARPHPFLLDGRKVRVRSGPLVGVEGIVIRRKERFRLVLSIELLMRSVMIELDEGDVEPV